MNNFLEQHGYFFAGIYMPYITHKEMCMLHVMMFTCVNGKNIFCKVIYISNFWKKSVLCVGMWESQNGSFLCDMTGLIFLLLFTSRERQNI